MKKSLFLFLVMCGISLATAETTSNTTTFAASGSFTVTYEWESAPTGLTDIKIGYGDSASSAVSVSAANGYLSYSANGNTPDFFNPILHEIEGNATYYFSVKNYNTDDAAFIFSKEDTTIVEVDIKNGTNGRPQSVKSLTINQGGATVTLGTEGQSVHLESLVVNDTGTLVTPGDLTILSNSKKGNTTINNTVDNLVVNGVLTLGAAESAATLTAKGILKAEAITFGNVGSTATADKLETQTLNVDLSDNFMTDLNGGSATLLTLNEEYSGTIKLSDTLTMNGTDDTLDIRSEDNKYIYTLSWETQLARAAANQWNLVLSSSTNPSYVQEALTGIVSSRNGFAGMNLLNDAFAELNPQAGMAGGAMAGLIDAVDDRAISDNDLAAVAGASVAILGQALSGDAERQLRAIRNRAVSGTISSDTITVTSLDEKGNEVSTTKTKKFCMWVNAEGNLAEQDADGTAAGYTLSSWGGTVGAGMQVNNNLGMGLALTAMRGDLESDGPDSLDGDMDTTYLSAFARYRSGVWSHSLIGTVGTMDTDYTRTVNHAAGSYTTDGDTEGTAFGLMYELSRQYTLSGKSRISPVFNISYRHTEVDGYSESNSDAAVNVGDQSLDTVTVGLGARYEATVGQQTINRACAFEARALAKYDLGDRQTDTTVGFIGQATRGSIESAEFGSFGVEMGAGIAVPVGPGSIFADGAIELRSDYTNFNATVGYKIQF